MTIDRIEHLESLVDDLLVQVDGLEFEFQLLSEYVEELRDAADTRKPTPKRTKRNGRAEAAVTVEPA